MSFIIGIILLLVFLCFAALMFLERISALLALPLMAIAFLLLTVGADLLQPATVGEAVSKESVDALGRRRVVIERAERPSRFEQWKRTRQLESQILKDKAALFEASVAALEAEVQGNGDDLPERLTAVLVKIRRDEQELRERADEALDELPQFFVRPPHTAGRRAHFDDAFNAIAISERLRPIATLLEGESSSVAVDAIRGLLADARADADRWCEEHAEGAELNSPGFRTRSALAYLFEYVIFVLRAGSLHLYAAIIATIFGGMFAMYVKNLKVAERLVYWTAEFAGERPFVIAFAVFLVTAGIFTSVGGLGTVIMLGAIILPALRSVGLGPIVAAGTFLIAIAMGGTLQPVARRLWMDFYGIPAARLDSILWTMVGLYALCGVCWIWWGTRRGLLSSFQAAKVEEPRRNDGAVPARLMLAPLIPVLLVYFGGVEEISAFTASIAYMYVCVCRRQSAVRVLARSLIEGAQSVMPPVLLMVGIGILITALSTPPVQSYLRPLLSVVVPDTRWGYIALFALAAPLALYRGPLNVWGMGLAVSATLLATSTLPPAAILCAILAAGMLQGVCDPTNTANVWIAGFQGISVNQILRYTILPVWAAAILAVVIFGLRFVGVQ